MQTSRSRRVHMYATTWGFSLYQTHHQKMKPPSTSHSLTFTHPLLHSLYLSLSNSFIHSHTHLHSLTCSLSHHYHSSLIHSTPFIHSYSCTYSLTQSHAHSFTPSHVHSFAPFYSFAQSSPFITLSLHRTFPSSLSLSLLLHFHSLSLTTS